MNLSDAGLHAIWLREGHRNKAYRDSRGLWTVGVGHLLPQKGSSRFVYWSDQVVEENLRKDLERFVACVNKAIGAMKVSQNQFDAMVSLAFNIGEHGFTGSSVARMVRDGHIRLAADDFLLWEHPPELKHRREDERKQFLTP